MGPLIKTMKMVVEVFSPLATKPILNFKVIVYVVALLVVVVTDSSESYGTVNEDNENGGGGLFTSGYKTNSYNVISPQLDGNGYYDVVIGFSDDLQEQDNPGILAKLEVSPEKNVSTAQKGW